jgi:RNA polymerase primary sigma factor
MFLCLLAVMGGDRVAVERFERFVGCKHAAGRQRTNPLGIPMATLKAPVRRSPTTTASTKARSAKSQAAPKPRPQRVSAISKRVDALHRTEIDFIPNDSFRLGDDELSGLAAAVERGDAPAEALAAGLPAHLGRMSATRLLTPDEERDLFRRMNYCKFRASVLRSKLSRTAPSVARVTEIEDCLHRATNLRNHLIQANTRLVMSIARRFANNANCFDDLLSHGLVSLMHAIEKFDYDRGYRFSTYATCAVRRDLCRHVMTQRRDSQRYSTGAELMLNDVGAEPVESQQLTEPEWRKLNTSLARMIERLDERERFIVTHRFGLGDGAKRASYNRLGQRMGISKERVRQLANRAMEKLREWAPDYRLEALVS